MSITRSAALTAGLIVAAWSVPALNLREGM